MEANTNPDLEKGFCTTGTKIDIPEQLQLLGITPENPTIHGHVINKLFNMIFENLNHQKKKGISFWESDEEYEATTNNIDICRRNNKIYFCKQSHNDTGTEPKDPANNPDYWTVLYDLDKPLFDEFNKYALKNGSVANLFKVKKAENDEDAVTKKQMEDAIANEPKTPAGIISLWSGSISTIPSGWFLCNGANGTPDLRNRFIYGASVDGDVGATGGSKDAVVVSHNHGASSNSTGSHTHTANHNHSASSNSTGSHIHSMHTIGTNIGCGPGDVVSNGACNTGVSMNTNSAGTHSHSITVNTANVTTSNTGSHAHTITVNNSGVSGIDKNLPPYMELAYIMKG